MLSIYMALITNGAAICHLYAVPHACLSVVVTCTCTCTRSVHIRPAIDAINCKWPYNSMLDNA